MSEPETLAACFRDPESGEPLPHLEYADRYLDYMASLLRRVDRRAVAQIMDTFAAAVTAGRSLYFIANGGSAAVASHFANDLCIGTRAAGWPPIKAVSLVDNSPILTALANDEGYDKVFTHQLEGFLEADDVVVALSVSGNSPNIVSAVRFAKQKGAVVIGCSGFDGGELHRLADISLHLPTERGEYGPVEDMFSVLNHLIASHLIMSRRGQP